MLRAKRVYLLFLVASVCPAVLAAIPSVQNAATTAWHHGRFVVNVHDVVSESDIVLGQPNVLPSQAMPLGNGRLGVAVWSASGMTVQLNRADTMPRRLSPGQVILPGLVRLTGAKDYRGRLDLYNGQFEERGGGMTATAYVQPGSDMLMIDVTGADPNRWQIVNLILWAPRKSRARAVGKMGMLMESWIDNIEPGASGREFGSLAALSAKGRRVSVAMQGNRTIVLSVMPYANGTFRVLVPVPDYNGKDVPQTIISQALTDSSPNTHRIWWNTFWRRAGLMKVSSPHGSGEYMENLRAISLFTNAAERGQEYPGSQAGVADLFSSVRDVHRWDPAAFWHLNLSMLVAANLGAGLPELNSSYFNLYRENLKNIESWTFHHMAGRVGACIPETLRFNGVGIEYEGGTSSAPPVTALDCDADSKPFYNARTLSTGAEVSLWVWRQYLATNSRPFLARNYPLMAASARFLLAYEKLGGDGLLHTSPSNAHETQWDTTDPTTDIAARMALFPATIQAADLLGEDVGLVKQLRAALKRIPPLPRTQERAPLTLLRASDDTQGQDVIADSYVPKAKNHNVENIGLYPVWPFGLIGDSSPLLALARRTYAYRPYPVWPITADWSFDPIQAARLDLGGEVSNSLIKLTETYQRFPNGLASWGGGSGAFYVEQAAVTATALQEALVQDYDGVIRIAPAIPPGWNFAGTVFVRGRTKVNVQTDNGIVTTLVIEAGTNSLLKLRNPWPGTPLDVRESTANVLLVKDDSHSVVSFPVLANHAYIITPTGGRYQRLRFAPITGEPARTAKRLGTSEIGLDFPAHS
jgi:alpha-L-fucosidase 2